MILACKKKLGKTNINKWEWVRPPPLVWEIFPHNPVFFSEDVPKSKRYIHATSPVNTYSSEVKTDFRRKTWCHWMKLRSSGTKIATGDRLVAKRPQFWWLRSRSFRFFRWGPQKGLFGAFLGPRAEVWGQSENANFSATRGPWGPMVVGRGAHVSTEGKRSGGHA